jgi:hypothetical protein
MSQQAYLAARRGTFVSILTTGRDMSYDMRRDRQTRDQINREARLEDHRGSVRHFMDVNEALGPAPTSAAPRDLQVLHNRRPETIRSSTPPRP